MKRLVNWLRTQCRRPFAHRSATLSMPRRWRACLSLTALEERVVPNAAPFAPPSPPYNTGQVRHDTLGAGGAAAFDDGGGLLTYQLVNGPTHGGLDFHADGFFFYQPDFHFVGQDSFTFIASDGQLWSEPITFTLNVTNKAPVIYNMPSNVTTLHDTPLTAGFTWSDDDPALTFTVISGPEHGSVQLDPASSRYTYTPDAGFTGEDSFAFIAFDGIAYSNVAVVTVHVSDGNEPPVAEDDDAQTVQNTPVSIDVLGNDYDPDGDPLAVTGVTQGEHGSVSFTSGGVTYTPDAGYTGLDSFSYTITDGHGHSDSATVTVSVESEPANPQPVIRFVNAKGETVTSLRIAKWVDGDDKLAFEQTPAGGVKPKDNFYDLSPDRFHVRVYDAARNTDPTKKEKIKIKFSTNHSNFADNIPYLESEREIELIESDVNSGMFWSPEWWVLVSNPNDDRFEARGIKDNDPGDPTFRAPLGGTVKVKYTDGANQEYTKEASVPVEKVVKLHINILKKDGTPVVTEDDVKKDVQRMREIYAQMGIKVEYTVATVDPPEGVDLDNGLQVNGGVNADGQHILTAEEESLLKASALRTADATVKDIEVYYVNPINGKYGYTYQAARLRANPEWANTSVIGSDRKFNTLAHEVMHALMNTTTDEHVDGLLEMPNLMARAKTAAEVAIAFTDTETGSQRVTVKHANDALKSDRLLPPPQE